MRQFILFDTISTLFGDIGVHGAVEKTFQINLGIIPYFTRIEKTQAMERRRNRITAARIEMCRFKLQWTK